MHEAQTPKNRNVRMPAENEQPSRSLLRVSMLQGAKRYQGKEGSPIGNGPKYREEWILVGVGWQKRRRPSPENPTEAEPKSGAVLTKFRESSMSFGGTLCTQHLSSFRKGGVHCSIHPWYWKRRMKMKMMKR